MFYLIILCVSSYFAEIDMYEYFEDCIHAARLYILKETDDTIPAAKRHMKVYVSFKLNWSLSKHQLVILMVNFFRFSFC